MYLWLKNFLKKNKYLVALYRAYAGTQTLILDYKVDFKPRWEDNEGNAFLSKIIKKNADIYATNINSFDRLNDGIGAIDDDKFNLDLRWDNGFIPALDGICLMWAASNTKGTFVEVGSGNSTKFLKTTKLQSNSAFRLLSIDPCPRSEINSLCDQIIRQPLESCDLSIFENLKKGDTVFIDNSHRSFMNSDVTTTMLDVLPRLRQGVRIGFHDIFLPFDYFENWSERGYNEQYLLASYLLSNENYFRIELPCYWLFRNGYFDKFSNDRLAHLDTKIRQRAPSAFWVTKV